MTNSEDFLRAAGYANHAVGFLLSAATSQTDVTPYDALEGLAGALTVALRHAEVRGGVEVLEALSRLQLEYEP